MSVIGRENPFSSVINPKEAQHSHTNIHKEPLSNIEFVLPSTARSIQSIQITYQNLDGSIGEKTIQLNESIDWHYPLVIAQKALNATYSSENRFKLGEFELIVNKNTMFIYTRKKMVRNFTLPEPYRLVIDVEDVRDNILEEINLNKKFFSIAQVSTHDGFYRISLALDGRYKHTISPQRDGFLITLE